MRRRPLRVLMVSAEVLGFARTGGLGDVVAALSQSLADLGADVIVATPQYGVTTVPANATWWEAPVEARLGSGAGDVHSLGVLEVASDARASADATSAARESAGRLRVCLLANAELFGRGGIYGDARGTFADNGLRFAILSRGALAVAERAWGPVRGDEGGPDVIHAHDWHAALAVLYPKLVMSSAWRARPAVFTIHNLAFQGTFDEAALAGLGLPREAWTEGWVRHEERVNLMKGAIELAERVTTVSRTYAREILEPESGYGLDAHLRYHAPKLVGIVNGIDTRAFDPATDPALAHRYDAAGESAGKRKGKRALLAECGFDAGAADDDAPLFASVSRLSSQKGIDLVAAVVPSLVARGARVLFVGQGDGDLERTLLDLAAQFPGRVVTKLDFDPVLARRVFAGSDFLLVPSRYEPCGLTQLYAMRYGSIPIVTPVGGLKDTVVALDVASRSGTGIVAAAVDSASLFLACEEALGVYADRAAFAALVGRAMARDSAWASSAREYLHLYEEITAPHHR
jgi:starch synthase